MSAPAPDSTPDSRSGTVAAGQAAPLVELGWLLGEIIADVEHVTASGNASYIDRDMLDDYRERAAAILDSSATAAIAAAAPAGTGALSESQQFQVSEARDILGTWDLNNPGGVSRETVLADHVRALLAILDSHPEQPQAAPGADAATCPACSATLNRCWSCGTDTRKAGQ